VSIGETVSTDYYLVAVDDNGDVMAGRMVEVSRKGLDITLRSASIETTNFAFENQGDDAVSKWESARDALASIMPDDGEDEET
jgi:hypothetical protein